MSYNQLTSLPDPSFPIYSSTDHFPSTDMSQSEQMMVKELITSMTEDLTPQLSSNTSATTPITAENTRPLHHINEPPNLPAYTCNPTPDLYSTSHPPSTLPLLPY